MRRFLVLFLLASCDEKPPRVRDQSVDLESGTWTEIRPYPGAIRGTKCFVYSDGVHQTRYGGPVCVSVK